MQRQDALAHNLANASTTGFRAELHGVSRRAGARRGRHTRVYALESTTGLRRHAGPGATGRTLDVAVQGNSWLAVQALDGTEAYTRGGP